MKLMRWLMGWVRFRIVSPHGGEIFLNCCTRAGIHLWQVRPGKKGMTACVRAGQYRVLRKPARQAHVRLRVQRRCGLPLKIAHLRGRPGLAAGAALFCVVLLGLGQFFWTVEISGCKSIPEKDIRSALQQQGIAPGCAKRGFSARAVQTRLMEKFPNISWVSVNDHGGDVYVQLTEKDEQPPVTDQRGWYQLQAVQSGVVVEMHIHAGTAKVQVGDGVSPGQLLVSPVVENKDEKFMALYHAAGTVIAQTSHTLTVQMPFAIQHWEPAGPSVERRALSVFGVQLPLSMQLSPKGKVQRSGERTAVHLCGKELPLTVTREVLTPVRQTVEKRTRRQAEAEAVKMLAVKEKTDLPGAKVVQHRDTVKEDKTGITVIRKLTCRENIAKEVKIAADGSPA